MNKKVIDQLDCMIFPSIVSLKPPGCLEWLNWYSYCFEGIASCTENRKADFVIGNSVLYACSHGTFIDDFVLLINELPTQQRILIVGDFNCDQMLPKNVAKVDSLIHNFSLS